MSIKHAKLSASGAHRWMTCSGSIKAEEGLPESHSAFAEEGTAAHELAELALTTEHATRWYVGTLLPETNYLVTQEMAEYVQMYVDFVLSLGGMQMYEQRVDFSEWVPEGFGTSDALVLTDDGTLHVCDLKYGKGIRVDAQGNEQGMLYALGAYSMFNNILTINQVQIKIIQPRLDHVSESDPISIPDLLKFGEKARLKAEEALSDNAKRSSNEKACQFCKAKATCGELKRVTEQAIMAQFDNIEAAPMVNTLSDEQLRFALDNKKLIVSWLDAVEALVNDRLVSGEQFDGYKLVEGRSLREWANELEAEVTLKELLGDEAYTKKLLSVAQAEKVLGKANADKIIDLVSKPKGKPALAPESDKRPAINISADSFGDM